LYGQAIQIGIPQSEVEQITVPTIKRTEDVAAGWRAASSGPSSDGLFWMVAALPGDRFEKSCVLPAEAFPLASLILRC
jgi:hypothetical protein